MGEKRAYKSRKSGGGRKKLKPKYDAGKNLKEQMDAAVALYEENCFLQSIADALNLNANALKQIITMQHRSSVNLLMQWLRTSTS